MNNADALKLKKLIREKKYDEVKSTLLSLMRKPWDAKKQGKVFTQLGSAYMKAQTNIRKRALNFFQGADEILAKIAKKEKEVKESGRMEDVRRRLSRM